MEWYAALYPTKQDTASYELARLIQLKHPEWQVEAIVQWISQLSPAQLSNVKINNGIAENATAVDPHFGLPYPSRNKPRQRNWTEQQPPVPR